MLRTLVIPAALGFAILGTSCDGGSKPDAADSSIDTNIDNGVARCDMPEGGTSCGSCYNASGDRIIDCENCLGTDGMPHVLC